MNAESSSSKRNHSRGSPSAVSHKVEFARIWLFSATDLDARDSFTTYFHAWSFNVRFAFGVVHVQEKLRRFDCRLGISYICAMLSGWRKIGFLHPVKRLFNVKIVNFLFVSVSLSGQGNGRGELRCLQKAWLSSGKRSNNVTMFELHRNVRNRNTWQGFEKDDVCEQQKRSTNKKKTTENKSWRLVLLTVSYSVGFRGTQCRF